MASSSVDKAHTIYWDTDAQSHFDLKLDSYRTTISVAKPLDSSVDTIEESEFLQSIVFTLKGSPVDNYLFHRCKITNKRKVWSPLFCSCRLILSIVSCLGMVNLYMLSCNLNAAMPWMVRKESVIDTESNGSDILRNEVPAPPIVCTPIVHQIEEIMRNRTVGEFDWSKHVQTITKISIHFGYLVTNIPGGWLAERYGGKWLFGMAVLASGLCNLFIPVAARSNITFLIAVRIVIGLFQGVSWPAMFVMWSRWAPVLEKQKLTILTFSGFHITIGLVSFYIGSILGVAINFPVVSLLSESGQGWTWPFVFYIPGITGILWSLAWFYFVFDSPETHPRISKNEKAYICYSRIKCIPMYRKNHPPTPWKSMLTSKPALALMAVCVINDFALYFLMVLFTTYLTAVLGYNDNTAGIISAVPYIGFFIVSIASSVMYDSAIGRNIYVPTLARKIGNTIGTSVPAIFVFAASFLTCNERYIILCLIIICVSTCGFQYGAGFLTNYLDLAPIHVGVFFGISNTLATVADISASYVFDHMTANQLMNEWQKIFMMLAAIYLFSAVIFMSFGSANIQEWAAPQFDKPTYIIERVRRLSSTI